VFSKNPRARIILLLLLLLHRRTDQPTDRCVCFSLMKRRFAVSHTVRHTEIPTLLDSRVTNTPPGKVCPHTNCLSVYLRKNITRFSVRPLRIGHAFSVCSKTVYRWVTANCCLISIYMLYICMCICVYIHIYIYTHVDSSVQQLSGVIPPSSVPCLLKYNLTL
jgi:hypothetical protein